MAVITFSISCEKEKEEIDDNPTTEEKTFGLQETPASELAQIPIASPMTYTGSFPNQFYLETPPPEEDGQGSEGSCVGWAVAYGMKSYHLQESYYDINGDFNYSSVCSPEYVYNQIKVGDCGSGAQFAPAFELLKNQGVCSWDIMPYSDNNGCSTMPNATQTENANQHKILSYERITDLSEQNLKILLLNKYPIVIGARLDDHFMQADEDFIWQAPFGVLRGLHAMVICGYDDNKQAFKIINSWGRDFGDDGYVWCDYDFLSDVVFEAYITEPDENNNNNGTLPTVSTNNISDITENSAVSGGNISSDGGSSITVKGVCWSVNQNPTVSDSKTTDGAGINSYTSSITNLSANTTYYVRAYATNQNGTAYGEQKTFTTTGNNNTNEKIFFVARPSDNEDITSLYYLDIETEQIIELFSDDVLRHSVTVSNDKTKLAYVKEITSSNAYICTSNLNGDNEQEIWQIPTNNGQYMALNLDWHPNQNKLIFYYGSYRRHLGNRDGDIWELDMNTLTTTELTTNFDYQEPEMSYSPNGNKIVYSYKPETWFDWPRDIYIMNADGTNPIMLDDDTGYNNGVSSGGWPCDCIAANPEFSPDGNKIIFDRGNDGGLYTMNIDGSNNQQLSLSSGGNYGYHATYNPSGDKIAFMRDNNLVIAYANGTIIKEFSPTTNTSFYTITWID